MYPRLYKSLKNKSLFLFGPRGTGKTTWLKSEFPRSQRLDLLNSETARLLLAMPGRLEGMISKPSEPIIIDEVQKEKWSPNPSFFYLMQGFIGRSGPKVHSTARMKLMELLSKRSSFSTTARSGNS